jgi:plastocyanin
MRGHRITAGVGLVVVGLLLAAGCSSSSKGSGTTATTAAAAAGTATTAGSVASTTGASTASGGSGAATLVAHGVSWNTTKLSFNAGEKVTVTVQNKDGVEHNFTFKAVKANTDVKAGTTAKATFAAPTAGTYEFHCEYHPAKMKGTVTVTA